MLRRSIRHCRRTLRFVHSLSVCRDPLTCAARCGRREVGRQPGIAPMTAYEKLRQLVIGAPLDPLSQQTRQHIALAAFLAWVGLGADGLSSSAYGPEEAFRALGAHTHLGLFMALATAATVFIISLAYNQVIELFPTGGGGYRVATSLIGPARGPGFGCRPDRRLCADDRDLGGERRRRAVQPAARIGRGVQALALSSSLVTVLLVLNLRGMRESITLLLPIFLGFFITHTLLIAYGILGHSQGLTLVVPDALSGHAQARARHRLGRRPVAVSSRLLARRGHLHRHRGGVEQRADAARAARAHRQADDVLHGDARSPSPPAASSCSTCCGRPSRSRARRSTRSCSAASSTASV